MNATSNPSSRRYDIDWLRVLLILTVLVFHSLRFFDLEGWHVKNLTTYLGVQILIVFISRWMMPAIFVVSGMATYYALGKRGAGVFLKDRSLRLLVPLVVGIFTHVTIQGYLEQQSQYGFTGSFWAYYAGMFNGLVGLGGRFNWIGNHLWYLEVLLVLSVISLPLFLWLRRGSGQRVMAWLGGLLSKPYAIYLLALPTILLLEVLNPDASWLLTGDSWGGWNLPNHLVFFIAGFVIASSQAVQASIRRLRWVSLAAGVFFLLVGGVLYAINGDIPFGTPAYAALAPFSALIGWTWLLAIFGFGMQKLNFHTPFLDYANEAVMPFYVLHQTVLLIVGYYIVPLPIPDLLKWVIILPVSFAIIMALYELLVRRVNFLRVLFGMKPVHKAPVTHKPAVQVS